MSKFGMVVKALREYFGNYSTAKLTSIVKESRLINNYHILYRYHLIVIVIILTLISTPKTIIEEAEETVFGPVNNECCQKWESMTYIERKYRLNTPKITPNPVAKFEVNEKVLAALVPNECCREKIREFFLAESRYL